ncbi:calcium/sodium antiporter [Candidatus Pacearchaeota archaeon]|nr:calcium/sodium antiporter [Candidatus Pacearchaeota archaeon]
MLPLIVWIIIFAVSLFALIKASDYFIESSEKIGFALGFSPFIIGITIVAVGTSLPELVSSLFAVFKNSSEMVVANVIGSNIANIFLILGIAAIVGKKLVIEYQHLNVDLSFLIGSAALLTLSIIDGVFTIPEALICLALFSVYIYYSVSLEKKEQDKQIKKEMKKEMKKKRFDSKNIFIFIASVIAIYFSAKYTVDAVISLSQILNIGKELITVSALAIGTSLPELIVTIGAARKGKGALAVGNIMGSNTFNALVVMGIPALFGRLIIPTNILAFSLPMMVAATLMFFFVSRGNNVTRGEGFILVIFYLFFLAKLFNLF